MYPLSKETIWGLIIVAGVLIISKVILNFYKKRRLMAAADVDASEPVLAEVENDADKDKVQYEEKTVDEMIESPIQSNVMPDDEQKELSVADIQLQEVSDRSERYFQCEVMITAGPRKKFMSEPDADKDLGEDICGFVANGKQLLMWLMDGTSDLYCLKNPLDQKEYFSSRLLAQSVASKIRSAFNKIADTAMEEVLLQAVNEVRIEWLNVIEALPLKEKELLIDNIKDKNIPECATTLLIGHLLLNGDLSAYRSGDSKMHFYNTLTDGKSNFIETSLAMKNEDSNDRLFFRLIANAEGKVDIIFNVPKSEVVRQKNVSTLIAYSDGVGLETEIYLKETRDTPEIIKNEIIYHSQGTADDKSICFIEIKN